MNTLVFISEMYSKHTETMESHPKKQKEIDTNQ